MVARISVVDVSGPSWKNRFLCNQRGDPKPCSFNTRLILENDPDWKGVIAWCDFSQRVIKRQEPPLANASRGEWDDGDDADLRHWIAEHYGIEPRHTDLADAVLGVARQNRFHPVTEYLDGLTWDKTPRLASWLQTYCQAGERGRMLKRPDRDLHSTDLYHERVGTLWMIQSIARVRMPGCKADSVLILEGEQGRGKSTALKVLYGDEFFSDTPIDLAHKDAMESIRGLWCVEMAELDSLNKADARRAKAFFSSPTDRFRLPYGHRTAVFPRQVVVAGTTNQYEYLKDTTGNRRFMPVDCGWIDIEGLREARDQLWAEADHYYRSGHSWWVDSAEDVSLFADQQEDRVDADVWESVIQDWLHEKLKSWPQPSRHECFVTMADLMRDALEMDVHAMKRPEQTRVGQIVHAIGWHNTRPEVNGKRVRGYRPGNVALARVAAGEPECDDIKHDEPEF